MKTNEAVNQILASVNILAKLTQQVTYCSLECWDDQELQNMFHWASYAQELARKVDAMGAQFSSSLEKRLEQMSANRRPPLPVQFNLTFLRHCMVILLQILSHNPTFPDALEPIKLQLMETRYVQNINQSMLNWLDMKKIKQCSVSAEEGLHALTKVLASGCEHSSEIVKYPVQHLLEKLTDYMAASRQSIWFDVRLSSILNRWTKSPNGWFVLVTHLRVDLRRVALERQKEMLRLVDVIISWMVCQYQQHEKKCPMWQIPSRELAALCEYNQSFCKWYIGELESIGDRLNKQAHLNWHMQQSIDSTGNLPLNGKDANGEVTEGGGSATAGQKEEQIDLAERLQQLLQQDSNVKAQAMCLLLDKVRGNREHGAILTSIWRTIAFSTMKRNGEM